MPVYATRAIRREFVNTCDTFLDNVEKSRVCQIYKKFVGDSTTNETEIDVRVKLAFDLRDPDIITDIQHFNEERISIYNTFWEYAKKFLEGTAQDSVVAVDKRHHDPIVHLARAISVEDLKNQIAKLYLEELAIKFRNNIWLIFLDDKHRCKIKEPGHPVAAIEHEKQVVVTTYETFAVSDHDFTKCSLIPSVTMICNIPDNIEGSFYQGQVNIGLKDTTFQASSSLRYMTELYDMLIHTEKHHLFLMLYTDGGPDHKNTFLRVQLSLIAMFVALDLDYLVAVRILPGHS
ncbi:hypothetical protein RclHR1_00350010 [Rhizophagus clarus]|uniref:Uncharacterized protein n=1 Tax=Rhizophagus clarus TaxID=94130 RepID=A0A2Z6RMH8_9GLOM|nr:hypothetical protein RclHR1_00350010 [Rhizophagus clarus]GES88437.1 hypothetical protein GLOIN_2v1782174 [Rhizophagus clarus]